jgi:rRNA maturation RNase YbeY
MKVHLLHGGFLSPRERAALRRLAAHVARAEGSPATELAVKLTDDAGITEVNAEFLKRPWPTDVISFPDGERRPDGALPLGDIVISVETARRNARRYRQTAFREIRRLAVHGILHLLGYSHKRDDAAMKRLERKYLR